MRNILARNIPNCGQSNDDQPYVSYIQLKPTQNRLLFRWGVSLGGWMSSVQRVSPVLEQAIAALLNRAEYDGTVSIKAAVKEIRRAAPYLAASDEELTEAIFEVSAAMGLSQ
ncbi:hypothetical protein NKH98_23165 [Mesorhizobium sp. M0833]|uniref:hypothetical protein n=1 Tax=Mesorhizobium sp. M0833 TaxID=2957009 RepID=UPI003339700A